MIATDLEQIAFKMQLDAGQAQVYRDRHDAIWPELIVLLKDVGISDYSIFLDQDTHVLFAILRRTRDHRMASLPEQEIMRRWWQHMGDIMQTRDDGAPVVGELVPMFHME